MEADGSAALDSAGVLQYASAAVLRLGHQAGAALLDGQVPGAGRQFGDRRRGAVLAVQRTRHGHREPERREVRGGRRLLCLRGLRLLRLGLLLTGLRAALRAERLARLRLSRLTAERLALARLPLGAGGARVAVTTLRLGAVGLGAAGLGAGRRGPLRAGTRGRRSRRRRGGGWR